MTKIRKLWIKPRNFVSLALWYMIDNICKVKKITNMSIRLRTLKDGESVIIQKYTFMNYAHENHFQMSHVSHFLFSRTLGMWSPFINLPQLIK